MSHKIMKPAHSLTHSLIFLQYLQQC